jgi:hypothetical protein
MMGKFQGAGRVAKTQLQLPNNRRLIAALSVEFDWHGDL